MIRQTARTMRPPSTAPTPSCISCLLLGAPRRKSQKLAQRAAKLQLTLQGNLVGHAANWITLRATVPVRIKARFAGNGRSLAKKGNAESHRHGGSRRAVALAPWAAFRSLDGPARTPALARLAHDARAAAECYPISRMAH